MLSDPDEGPSQHLEELARSANCGLASTDNQRLGLFAQSVQDMIDLAVLMVENRQCFERLPLPAALRKARGIEAPSVRSGRRGGGAGAIDSVLTEQRRQLLGLIRVSTRPSG
jgi:hypothetical protein